MLQLAGTELNMEKCFSVMNKLDEELCKTCLTSSDNCKNEYCQKYETEFDIRYAEGSKQ